MMVTKSKVVKITGLRPIVSGGDGKAQHKLIETEYGFELKPSLSENKVKIGFYLLSFVIMTTAGFLFIKGSVADGVLFCALGLGSSIVAKKNKGFGYTYVNKDKQEILRHDGKHLIRLEFSDVKYVEIIHKLKAISNGYISATNELNLALVGDERINISTGGDVDVIMLQADAIAQSVNVIIMHDSEKSYR